MTTKTQSGQTTGVSTMTPIQQIRYYMANPPSGSILMTITPALATDIINTLNINNRPPKPAKVKEYIDNMKNLNWAITGDTIKFSDIRLLDGQNRLAACAVSNISFQTHVIFGIDDKAFDRIDRGKNRSGSDILSIAGYVSTSVLSSAINWTARIESNNPKSREVLEPYEQLDAVQNQYKDLPNFINQALRIHQKTKFPNGLAAAFLYTFDRIDPKDAAIFAHAWESGNYARVPAFNTFNTAVLKTKAQPSGITDISWAVFLVITWNKFRIRRTGRQQDYNWNSTNPFPAII